MLALEPALHENQFTIYGFEWVDLNHRDDSVIVFRRKAKKSDDDLLIVLNMTPLARRDWKVYAKDKKQWKELFNSDSRDYWGTGDTFNPEIETNLVDKNENIYEINLHLPPLGAIILK